MTNPQTEQEREWIKQAQSGDQHAMAQLLRHHHDFLRKYLLKITLTPDLADDLMQETMLRCVQRIRMFKGESKFSTWLLSIASRLYMDELRKRKRARHRQDAIESSIRLAKWQSDSHNRQWPEVLDALGRLSEEHRVVVIMKHYYGYGQEEIADMLDLSVGTVKSRIHHGLHRLRKELNQDEEAR